MVRRISLRGAVTTLKKSDPILTQIIERVGRFSLSLQGPYFLSLTKAIVWQQISGKAARVIFNRLLELYDGRGLEPEDILNAPDEQLRSAGLSRHKTIYLKDLALKFKDGTLSPEEWNQMSDEEIIQNLIQVKGIGRWTAEMFLIFSLGRLDVLPVDDLGLRKAIQKAYQLEELPRAHVIRNLAEPWRPYRTVATLYLWKSLEGPEGGQM